MILTAGISVRCLALLREAECKLGLWSCGHAIVNYEQTVEPSLKTPLSDSEQAMLMGGAYAKACGWSPKKG
jgi:hypothetical protein